MQITTYNDKISKDTSDSVLVKQVATGSQKAFEILVQRYQAPLFHFIFHYCKDEEITYDISQHAFFQLYLHIPQLSTNLITQNTANPVKSWLYRVAWNRCMDELGRKRPLLFSEIEHKGADESFPFLETLQDPDPLPEEIIEKSDMQRDLYQAIEALPYKLRRVVVLRCTAGLTFVEIGKKLNIPQNTAKTYFRRAHPLLRTALEAQI